MLFKCFFVGVSQLLSNKKIIPFGVQIPLLFEIFTGETNGDLLEKIVIYIIAAVGLGNEPAVNIYIAVGVTENLEAIKKLPALLTFLQDQISGMLFVQQTHSADLLWPGNKSLQPCTENNHPGSLHHTPNP